MKSHLKSKAAILASAFALTVSAVFSVDDQEKGKGSAIGYLSFPENLRDEIMLPTIRRTPLFSTKE